MQRRRIDPISFGATVAAAMELFQAGAITTEHTGGIDLSFGNRADALVQMAELTAKGEGFGKGSAWAWDQSACARNTAPELSMTVKARVSGL